MEQVVTNGGLEGAILALVGAVKLEKARAEEQKLRAEKDLESCDDADYEEMSLAVVKFQAASTWLKSIQAIAAKTVALMETR